MLFEKETHCVEHIEELDELVLLQHLRNGLHEQLEEELARIGAEGLLLDDPLAVDEHWDHRAAAQQEADIVDRGNRAHGEQQSRHQHRVVVRVDHHVVRQVMNALVVQRLAQPLHFAHFGDRRHRHVAVVRVGILRRAALLEPNPQKTFLLAEQLQDGGEGVAHHEVVVDVRDVGADLHLRAQQRTDRVRVALHERRAVQTAVHAPVQRVHEQSAVERSIQTHLENVLSSSNPIDALEIVTS